MRLLLLLAACGMMVPSCSAAAERPQKAAVEAQAKWQCTCENVNQPDAISCAACNAWRCPQCTLINSDEIERCTACDAPRPAGAPARPGERRFEDRGKRHGRPGLWGKICQECLDKCPEGKCCKCGKQLPKGQLQGGPHGHHGYGGGKRPYGKHGERRHGYGH
jgi:hypothetical protein